MIGYDIGARINLDDASTRQIADADARFPQIQSIIEGIDKKIGTIPEMFTGIAGNITDLAATLSGIADAADRMRGDDGARDGFGAYARSLSVPNNANFGETVGTFGGVGSLPFHVEHSQILDVMPTMFSAHAAGSMVADAMGGVVSPSSGPQAAPSDLDVITATVGAQNIQREALSQTYRRALDIMMNTHGVDQNASAVLNWTGYNARNGDGSQHGQNGGRNDKQFDAIISTSESSDWWNDRNFDHLSDAAHFVKSSSPRANPVGDSESVAKTDGALDFFAEARSGLSQFDDASKYLVGKDLNWAGRTKEGDAIGAERPLDNQSSDFNRLAIAGNSRDDFRDSRLHEWRMRHIGGQNWLDEIHATGGGATNSSANGAGEIKSQISGQNETLGDREAVASALLWEMLKSAERILPKLGNAEVSESTDKADAFGGTAIGSLGSPGGLLATGFADDMDVVVPNNLAGVVGPGAGRQGPTGHRNDPIYTVAISPAAGTLMPMVPTSGISARTPPLPGQRNLP